IGIGFREETTFDVDHRAFVLAVTRQASLAVERALLYASESEARAEAERVRERLDFLSAAAAQLAATPDYAEMLRKVARLAVPATADWCAVYIVSPSGSSEAVEVAHRDADKVALARDVVRRFPVSLDSPRGPGRVIRTGVVEVTALRANDPSSEEAG